MEIKLNNCFALNGFKTNLEINMPTSETYFAIYCQIAKKYLLKTKEYKNFIINETKLDFLLNYFDDEGI